MILKFWYIQIFQYILYHNLYTCISAKYILNEYLNILLRNIWTENIQIYSHSVSTFPKKERSSLFSEIHLKGIGHFEKRKAEIHFHLKDAKKNDVDRFFRKYVRGHSCVGPNKTKFGEIFKETLKQNSQDSETSNTFRVRNRIWQT